MIMEYKYLEELLEIIDEPNKSSAWDLYTRNYELFWKAKGSKTKHQEWKGGYLDHITDCMNYARLFFGALESTRRPLPFSLSDALLVLYLHDVEKPFKQTGEYPELEINDIKQEEAIYT